ncbi:hypothetical protein CYMTET_40800 [Cymbomonas tetramitiformis]|uniref:Pesticidal crystal protein Cry22Aa Ig-like domain-containing protein n=1 Tax=Cymbomonas tetramitiformis TaxID=36881 RepID=A0AAE0C8N4_9CHLO|nr:hypothetical protein CYMTET_40800 [Cymbomonas tetramitiformis]
MYEDAYEERLPPPDTEPPEITLQGKVYTEILQTHSYVDAGVLAYDEVDGYEVEVTVAGVSDVDTCCVTDPEARFRITYTATDAAGNRATALREVAVTPLCEPPSYLCDNIASGDTCAICEEQAAVDGTGDSAAEVVCECLDTSFIAASNAQPSSVVDDFEPEADNTPPTLTLLGDGQRAVTTAGCAVMLHHLLQGDAWADPGVRAHDDVDVDLSHAIASYGGKLVDTAVATPTDQPYVITYSVTDSAGNKAADVKRRVYVDNPCASMGERVCHSSANGSAVCSESDGQLCPGFITEDEEVPDEPETTPNIELIGPAAISVPQGEPYAACPVEHAVLSLTCDRGAAATDDVDGDLTDRVVACSPDGVANRFANLGLSGCSIDTNLPGTHAIVFTVTNSVGLNSCVTRNLTVIAACPMGESLCADDVSCSVQGTCIEDLSRLDIDKEKVVNALPTVTLLFTAAVPTAYVSVKQHSEYRECREGEELNSGGELLCEPDEGPPRLSQHKRGGGNHLRGRFPGLRLHVTPAQNASASRTVTISQPCASGEELCDDLACSDIPCETRATLLSQQASPDTAPPVIAMLHSATARVIYANATTSASLGRCNSSADADLGPPHICLATATDDVSGDVSASIVLRQDMLCDDCSSNKCSPEQSHLCFPGKYGYVLTAIDSSENIAYSRQYIAVTEEAIVQTTLNMSAGTTNVLTAEEEAARLADGNSTENAAFREGIATLLGNVSLTTGGEELLPEDVTVISVTVRDAAGMTAAAPSSSGGTGMALEQRGALFLDIQMSLTTRVAATSTSSAGARRLLDTQAVESDDALMQHAQAVAAALVASTEGDSMTTALAQAAAANGVNITTEIAEASEEATTSRQTSEVDEAAALRASLRQEVTELGEEYAGLSDDIQSTLESLKVADGSPGEWKERLLTLFDGLQQEEQENADALMAALEDLAEKYDRLIATYEVIPEDTRLLVAQTMQGIKLAERQDLTEALQDHADIVKDKNGNDIRRVEYLAGKNKSDSTCAGHSYEIHFSLGSFGSTERRRELLRVSCPEKMDGCEPLMP